MANTILITANWHTGALSQQTISRQYDNNRYVVQFVGYPEASDGNELDYYLLVWMSSAPGEMPDEIAPIQLASDQWSISNFFTQQTQQIKFQMCALNTAGTFEAHSPIFTGFVRNSLEHDGTTQDIDVSTLFDAYREYLNELIIRAGAVVIDPTPTQGSTNAVRSGGVYEALHNTDTTLSQSGQAADAKVTGDRIGELKADLNESKNGKMFINGSFSYGIFNSSNFPESDPRKFNAVMMMAEKYDRDITITSKTGYNFLTYWYNDSDAYVGKSANWETSKTIPANTPFRLWVRPTPLDTSVILDLVAVKESIVFNSEINDWVEKNANDIAIEKANIYAIADGHVFLDTEFIYGKMNTTTGAVVPDTTKYQVVMPDFITAYKDLTLNCNSGYRYQVWWYTDQDVYISRTGSFKTAGEKYTVPAGTNFRLFVTLDPPNIQAIVPIDTFVKNVFIVTEVQNQVANIQTKPLTVLPDYILNSLSYKPVGVLSKGYILLSCDDGTAGLATYTIPMLINKNVPATFGLLMTSPVITNESYLSTVLDAVNNHGCCVAQHGSTQWTTYAEDALNKYFDDTEALFTEKGIAEIHGAICPGGAVADTNALVQAVAGGRFKSLFSGGLQGEIKYGNYNAVGARTNMYAMARYSAVGFTQATYRAAIDEAYDNHYILCPFWHDYSVVNDTAKQAIIEGMIDYAKTKGLTFITMADLPTII